jgi:hypothetical protein
MKDMIKVMKTLKPTDKDFVQSLTKLGEAIKILSTEEVLVKIESPNKAAFVDNGSVIPPVLGKVIASESLAMKNFGNINCVSGGFQIDGETIILNLTVEGQLQLQDIAQRGGSCKFAILPE